LKNGYNPSYERYLKTNEFTTLETATGQFYELKVCIKEGKKERRTISFRDSGKKILGSVAEIAESYKLDIGKGDIDHTLYRPIDYVPSPNEIDYVKRDVYIIGEVLKSQYDDGMIKMTSSADTLAKYKEKIGKKNFDIFFPKDYDDDKEIRKSYYGGVVQVKNGLAEKVVFNVSVYDVNSMYPFQMHEQMMPYLNPVAYNGKYKKDKLYPLYIQKISVSFDLKKGFVPTILKKKGRYVDAEYYTTTDDKMIELTLTNVDLELLKKHYHIHAISYIKG